MEGFRGHIAIEGSWKGVPGQDVVCGWAVVQLAYDQDEEPPYVICGTMLTEFVENDQKSGDINGLSPWL